MENSKTRSNAYEFEMYSATRSRYESEYLTTKHTVETFEKLISTISIPDQKNVSIWIYDNDEESFVCCPILVDDFIDLYNSTISRMESLEKKYIDVQRQTIEMESSICEKIIRFAQEQKPIDDLVEYYKGPVTVPVHLTESDCEYLEKVMNEKLKVLNDELEKINKENSPKVYITTGVNKEYVDKLIEDIGKEYNDESK